MSTPEPEARAVALVDAAVRLQATGDHAPMAATITDLFADGAEAVTTQLVALATLAAESLQEQAARHNERAASLHSRLSGAMWRPVSAADVLQAVAAPIAGAATREAL